jgi:hypothetical protein
MKDEPDGPLPLAAMTCAPEGEGAGVGGSVEPAYVPDGDVGMTVGDR